MNYANGPIYEIDANGNKTVFFPTNRADNVYTSSADTVEKKLNDKPDAMKFDTYAEYQASNDAGQIPAGTMCLINENIIDKTTPTGTLSQEIKILEDAIGDVDKLSTISEDGTLIGAFDTLQKTVNETVTSQIKTVNTNITSINTNINTINSDATSLATRVGTAEKNITNLTKDKANLASPTFTGTAKTTANTNYTTLQMRNVMFSTSIPSSLENGAICFVYS